MAHDSPLHWQAFCYFHDELSSEDRASFELLLADNQAAREALAEVVELSMAALSALGRSELMANASATRVAIDSSSPTALPARHSTGSLRHGSRRILWALAGLAATVLVGATLWIAVPHRSPLSRPSDPVDRNAGRNDSVANRSTDESRLKLAMAWVALEKGSGSRDLADQDASHQEEAVHQEESVLGADDGESDSIEMDSNETDSADEGDDAEDGIAESDPLSTDGDSIAPSWILIAVGGPDTGDGANEESSSHEFNDRESR